ncbi:hypothetical protein E2C01_018938 [Portunus trituberculatus]|uniref:Uncharacterized protein n=1 Tax=Portunus trituberculatus TaxID=210409 RepID=A0A5B7DWY3_PORTR|nr:hypothetical protein [Portunus trituberculatus]
MPTVVMALLRCSWTIISLNCPPMKHHLSRLCSYMFSPLTSRP